MEGNEKSTSYNCFHFAATSTSTLVEILAVSSKVTVIQYTLVEILAVSSKVTVLQSSLVETLAVSSQGTVLQ